MPYYLYSAKEINQLNSKEFHEWLLSIYTNPVDFGEFVPEAPTEVSFIQFNEEYPSLLIKMPTHEGTNQEFKPVTPNFLINFTAANFQFCFSEEDRFPVFNPKSMLLPRKLGNLKPDDRWLYECWCSHDKPHSRLHSNRRSNYENQILETAKTYSKDDTIHLLSLGSGGLFQDLLILLKLYFNGYRNIELDCLEIEDNSKQQEILQAIIFRLNQSDAKISVRHFRCLNQKEFRSYPIVYAIDFDAFNLILSQDFSLRNTSRDPENFIKYNSLAVLCMQAYLRTSTLFLISFGPSSIYYQNGLFNFRGVNLPRPFEESLEAHAYHDYYYINSNIINLLLHLPFLKEKNKPILINKTVVNNETIRLIKELSVCANLPEILIAPEHVFKEKLNAESALVLIIDDTDYSMDTEQCIDPRFQHGHVQISRCNTKSYPAKSEVFFKFNDVKAEQIYTKINRLSFIGYFNKLSTAIEKYLAQEGLVLTDAERQKVDTILAKIKSQLNPADFDADKAGIQLILRGSNNEPDLLELYVYSELTDDPGLWSLPDAEYKQILQKVHSGGDLKPKIDYEKNYLQSKQFLEAIQEGNLAIVQAYLHANRTNKEALNVLTKNHTTALIIAAYDGAMDIVIELLKNNLINIHAINDKKFSALSYAIFHRNKKLADLLKVKILSFNDNLAYYLSSDDFLNFSKVSKHSWQLFKPVFENKREQSCSSNQVLTL